MLGNKFLRGTGLAVSGTVLTSMVQCSIGFADGERSDVKSSDLVNNNGSQKDVSGGAEASSSDSLDAERLLKEKKLSEVLSSIENVRCERERLEIEKKEIEKIYQKKMKAINGKIKENKETYNELFERSNELKDSLGIETDPAFKEKIALRVKIFMYLLVAVPFVVAVTILIVMFSLKKENPTVGDAVNKISEFIGDSKNKVLNFFGVENS